MTICTFCGENIALGTGTMYVKDDGRVFNFCGKKCQKNQLKLNRNPVHIKWTKRFKR